MLSHKQRGLPVQLLSLTLFLVLLSACSSGSPASSSPSPVAQKTVAVPSPAPSPSPTITGPTMPGLKSCQPASPIDNSPVGPEVQGTGTNAELWALLQSTSGIPPVAKTPVKIVWRMTDSFGFTIVALGPAGLRVPPSEGPTGHLGSNWNRPGEEWGTVFTFPVAGCWDLHATTNGSASGDVWLKVTA